MSVLFFILVSVMFCSYWTEPDKINNVEHLGQLEISIRQSLDQLRAHKVSFV